MNRNPNPGKAMKLAIWLTVNRKTQKWLAEEIERQGRKKPTGTSVSHWCNGKKMPSLPMANAIVKATGGGVTHEDLENREGAE